MLRHIGKIVAAATVMYVLLQLYPIKRINPPTSQDVAASSPVEAILHRACYDCHSNETRWPWYARVAPVSWLVIWDVNRGRNHLNFSTWDKYADDSETEIRKLRNIDKVMQNGSMPPWYYLPMHSAARLSDADRRTVDDWVVRTIEHVDQAEQKNP